MDSHVLLGQLEVRAYRSALRTGVFVDEEIAAQLGAELSRVAEARKILQDLRLLSPSGECGPVVPLDPEVVEAELVTPLEMSIARRRIQIAGIHREFHSLAGLYRSAERSQARDVPIRILDDVREVRREIDLARHRCTEERLSLQPGGGRSAELLRQDLVQTQEMLRRGVRIRTLYQHTARASLTTRTYARDICAAGAEVRTAEELPERLIIYDRRIAFVPMERKGSEPPGAVVVTDPTLVAYLRRSFEASWQVGRPFGTEADTEADTDTRTGTGTGTEAGSDSEAEAEGGSDSGGGRQPGADPRSSILRLMSMGLKDEVIARRLGMATRTCRRYISALMDDLGATSRFQAGLLVGRREAGAGDGAGAGTRAGTPTAAKDGEDTDGTT
ncbi:hypothetical protein OG875_01865 [Streptomyces sp. NBC_01498]|uniref:LuxR C-terminal-related transcriptional regulator n=1 Tax=Streptomyces sp. NBC_01498 TaxID=2975870 RepID=UPI002E7B09C3|nr:hypothetical protein [Streptomyces sp. NBC_01498]WTL23458.1 hypothetical protein OG875_01865 [Streptomyces sp. NBC_01498]